MLCRSPGFTAVAVLTLALGIGANTAIFSVVHAVLLRPLPFPEPDRLVSVIESRERLGWSRTGFTYANFWDVEKESSSFSEIGAIRGTSLTLTGNDRPRRLVGRIVSPGLLRAFGITPVHGRLFEHGEELPDAEKVVILSQPLWRSTFAGDPHIIGQSVRLDGRSYLVVGVVDTVELLVREVDIFVPMIRSPEPNRRSNELGVVGRLAPGVSESSAAAELELLAARLESRHPKWCKGIGFVIVSSRSWVAGDRLRQALWVLLATTSFLLLIACVNLANMWLSKAVDRAHEAALRVALGAGQGRIIRQMLTESLMLCTVGAVAGVALAFGIVETLPLLGPLAIPRIEMVSVNLWVLAFTGGLTLLTGVLSGLVPAMKLRQADCATVLRSGDRTLLGSRGWALLRSFLVGAEVAISLVLLIGAGLLMRSFVELLQVERGMETENRLVASVNLPSSYDAPRTLAFFEQLINRVKSLPSVRSAAAVNTRPVTGIGMGMGIAGTPGETVPWAPWRVVTPGYFETLGLDIRHGRDFDQDIVGEPWRVVISESLATRLWPDDQYAVGRTVVLWKGQNEREAEVVGVVEDMRERGLAEDPTLAVYIPYYGVSGWPPEIIIHAADNPLDLVPTIRSILAEIDPELPLDDIATLDEVLSSSVSDRRLNTSLMGLFAGVALMLTLVGVYGVQAYAIARRAPEIGLRVVLGAQPEAILAMVVREGIYAAVVGAAAGVAAAFWLSKIIAGLLFGIAATDLMTYAGAAALLLGTILLACYLPARRALAVDPAEVLRAV
jgi:predicted permease